MKKRTGMSREVYEHIANFIDCLELDLTNGLILNRLDTRGLIRGYLSVCIGSKKVYQHQVLAVARWGDKCVGMTVNHINEIKTDNSWDNLELLTQEDNTRASSVRTSVAIKSINLVTGEILIFNSGRDASKKLNVHTSAISMALKGVRDKAKNYKFEYVGV